MKNWSEFTRFYCDFVVMIKALFSQNIKFFIRIMPQNIKTLNFLEFSPKMALLFIVLVQELSNKMVMQRAEHSHILDIPRTLLVSASCPKKFWGEAYLIAVYTINHTPSSIIGNISPYKRLYGSVPNFNLLRVLVVFVLYIFFHMSTKLEPCARLHCFFGYDIEDKKYKCWHHISNHLHVMSHHVTFWEHKMFSSLDPFNHWLIFPSLPILQWIYSKFRPLVNLLPGSAFFL